MSLKALYSQFYRINRSHAKLKWIIASAALFLVLKILVSRSSCKTNPNDIVMSISTGCFTYDRHSPLIFVGGVPRSGTTLMRSLLDTHRDIRCGEETLIVPMFLRQLANWTSSESAWNINFAEAGVTNDVMLSAAANFLLGIIAGHAEPAQILCNKDPLALLRIPLIRAMFPNSKFLFMIRDGRAVIHSLMTRGINVRDFNASSQEEAIVSWNSMMSKMLIQCEAAGPEVCLKVFYEQLVLHPERVTKEVFKFLETDWTSDVLQHENFIGKTGGISVSRLEYSTSQIIKPINTEALDKWVDWLEPGVKSNLQILAPMLEKLGYDITSDIPNYGVPDKIVLENVNRIENNKGFWKQREYNVFYH